MTLSEKWKYNKKPVNEFTRGICDVCYRKSYVIACG